MRGIVVGAVLSLVLWTALAWAIVCACTCFDVGPFTPSITALVISFVAIDLAAVSAAIWLALVCEDEEKQNPRTLWSVRLD